MYLNKVFIIGNLTRDPEIKALPSGVKVASFGIATNRYFKNKEGVRQDTTEFHNVTAFDKLGELSAQYLKKGQQALVEGRIQTRSWDAQDGQKKYRTEIIAENIQFGFRPMGAQGGAMAAGAATGASAVAASGSDAAKGGEAPADSGEKIDYPQEEINPDDIPF